MVSQPRGLRARKNGRSPYSYVVSLAVLFAVIRPLPVQSRDFKADAQAKPIYIDRVWAGTLLRYDAVQTEKAVYIAYYDFDRWLSVSRVDLATGQVSKNRLDNRFVGWDAHNSIAIAADSQGRVHVSGNMHTTPLVYARMKEPEDLKSVTLYNAMTGRDEKMVTYPRFLSLADGSLAFMYRVGRSGDGREIINHWNGQVWERWTDEPIFSSGTRSPTVSAYHTGPVSGPDRYFHFAWVWRDDRNVESNFHVCYAKTRDFRVWVDSQGRRISPPITPDNAEIVDPVPTSSGLYNNVQLGFDKAQRPVISYLKFDKDGNTQLFHARQENSRWNIYQSTDWHYRWDPRGAGTIQTLVSFSGVTVENDLLIERVRHPKFGVTVLRYDPESLKVSADLGGSYPCCDIMHVPRAAIPPQVVVNRVVQPSSGKSPAYGISWVSWPADNHDKPRACPPGPDTCTFGSELLLYKLGDGSRPEDRRNTGSRSGVNAIRD